MADVAEGFAYERSDSVRLGKAIGGAPQFSTSSAAEDHRAHSHHPPTPSRCGGSSFEDASFVIAPRQHREVIRLLKQSRRCSIFRRTAQPEADV